MTPEEPSVAIVIVEDQRAVRRGLELLVEGRRLPGGRDRRRRRAGPRGDPSPPARRRDRRQRPAGESGARLAQRLAQDAPEVAVLIYTGVYDASSLEGAIASGALGVALKAGSPEELLRAIRRVAMGELEG